MDDGDDEDEDEDEGEGDGDDEDEDALFNLFKISAEHRNISWIFHHFCSWKSLQRGTQFGGIASSEDSPWPWRSAGDYWMDDVKKWKTNDCKDLFQFFDDILYDMLNKCNLSLFHITYTCVWRLRDFEMEYFGIWLWVSDGPILHRDMLQNYCTPKWSCHEHFNTKPSGSFKHVYFLPYFGKWSNLTSIVVKWVAQPPVLWYTTCDPYDVLFVDLSIGNTSVLLGDSMVITIYGEYLVDVYIKWFLLLMEEILHHLGCMKPCK